MFLYSMFLCVFVQEQSETERMGFPVDCKAVALALKVESCWKIHKTTKDSKPVSSLDDVKNEL